MDIRIATRQSQLALWQAEHVAGILRDLIEVNSVKLVPLSTRGDEILDRSLQKIGGKGLFIKELEVAMQQGDADIAVHSMKDVPVDMPEGFCIAAALARANAADALVGKTLQELSEGARVGSSSLRRAAQLKMLRPDLKIEPLRGNVNTRLAKLANGDFDAIVLAAAGLERLGLEGHISQLLTPAEMLPAAAQGVIGIECLAENVELRALCAKINDQKASRTTLAERTIARILEADCQSPVAAHAVSVGSVLTITALVAMPDGSHFIRDQIGGQTDDAEKLATQLANQLIDQGAHDILQAIAKSGSTDD
jgi:hydroxymethylbilane synthase